MLCFLFYLCIACCCLDENKSHIAGFLWLSVYICNTTNKEDGILCFRDTMYTRATIPNPINITCPHHGRYVIYYNNRTHLPHPVGYSKDTGNNLKEVEVHGKFSLVLTYIFYKTIPYVILRLSVQWIFKMVSSPTETLE